MTDPSISIRRHLLAGAASLAVLFGGTGVWAHLTEFHGAVVANGQLVVDGNVKKVQHPTGGVVGEIRVRDGDKVKTGDLLVRLDETQAKASLAIVTKALDEIAARKAREEAERDGADRVDFPQALLDRAEEPEVGRLIVGERRLFEIRRATRDGQKAQLRERVAQLRQETQGVEAQERAKAEETTWIGQELEGVRDLWRKNLVQFTRVTTLERDRARIEGERGQLQASRAQTQGKISEIELQILQVDQDLRSEVGKDLAEMRGKASELEERRIAAEDQLKRVDIRSPRDGTVLQMSVHTVGGVIAPQGEPIMLIVPDADRLIVEAKVQPQDIDQLRVGQKAGIRFTAFDQRTTPEIDGELAFVSADTAQDPKTGAPYYTARISVEDGEIAKLKQSRLVPGMPAEVFVQTGQRTVLSYLMKPASDQIARAFRER